MTHRCRGQSGRYRFYDVNALSKFLTDAPALVGFEPFVRFVDDLEQRLLAARRPNRPLVGCYQASPAAEGATKTCRAAWPSTRSGRLPRSSNTGARGPSSRC